MSKLTLSAYIPSYKEYKYLRSNHKAYASADLTLNAINQGAEYNLGLTTDSLYCEYVPNQEQHIGNYPLRSTHFTCPDRILVGENDCSCQPYYFFPSKSGLRVAFTLKYDPKSETVQSCTKRKRTHISYNTTNENYDVYSNFAPIIIFGGKPCIWINKNECEKGTSQYMQCCTLKLHEVAIPFDKFGRSNDFGEAKELHAQCEKVLKEGCSEEELKMIVPVMMSDEDKYETATPIYELESNLE